MLFKETLQQIIRVDGIHQMFLLPFCLFWILDPLDANDVTIRIQGGKGPGGQHQNKKNCAVKMIHGPTVLESYINGRELNQNKKEAWKILTSRVHLFYRQQQQQKYDKNRLSQMGNGNRSDSKIRTYNFIKNLCIDHRLGKKTRQIEQVMKGRFDLILGS